MKKKVLVCWIVLSLLLCGYPTILLAEDSQESLSYTVEREEIEGSIYHHISLRGSLPAAAGREAKMVAVLTGTSEYTDQTVKALDQTQVDGQGGYSFSLTLAEAGTYLIQIQFNGLDAIQEQTISIEDVQFYNEIIARFNETGVTAAQLAEYISTYAGDLELYTVFYDKMSAAGKNGVGERMKKYSGSFRLDNINQIFNEQHIFAFLQYQDNPQDILDLIAFYEDSYLKLGSQANAANLYKSFLNLPVASRNAAIERWTGKAYNSFEEVRAAFNESVILGAFFNMSNSKFHNLLKDNNDYLQLSNYGTLEELQIDSILNTMRKNAASITSIETFRTAYEKAYSEVSNGTEKPSTNPPGGGGGGGSGPSGPSTSVNFGGNTTPDKPETVVPGQGGFVDLDSVPWAEASINDLFELGILNGKGEGIFAPNEYITREEFAKVLVSAFHLLDENAQCDFIDLEPEHWSYPYVASAKVYEMVKGYDDGRFGVGDPVTRQDMAVMVYRAMVNLKLVESLDSVTTEELFIDQSDIAPYALNSVIMLKNISLLSGDDNNAFLPGDNATRAEVAVLIDRVLNYKD